VPVALELDELEHFLDAATVRGFLAPHLAREQRLAIEPVPKRAWRATSRLSITLICGNNSPVLEGARKPERSDTVRPSGRDVAASSAMRPRSGRTGR